MRFFIRLALFFCVLIMISGIDSNAQTARIQVDGKSIAQGDTVKVCAGNGLSFRHSNVNTNPIKWTFNGGNTASSNTAGPIDVRFAGPGVFEIKQVVGNGSNADSSIIYIDVSNTKPGVSFSFTPNGECANEPINFTNNSSAGIVSYKWFFGDDSTSTAINPRHSFLSAIGASGLQNFTVRLEAVDRYGCTNFNEQVVRVKKVPDATIKSADQFVQTGIFNGITTFKSCSNESSLSFSFINGTSTASSIEGYSINWGDGSDTAFTIWPAATPIKHLFPRGNRVVTVQVTGKDGCIGIKKYNVFLGTTPAGGIASPGNTAICAPQDLTFLINNTSGNPPGTLYRLTFNDGSNPLVYQHPAPSSIDHTFLSSSCNSSINGYNNAFGLEMVIENPCGTTTGSVIPIYVSSKPHARIGIAPDTVVCTGTNVSINNSSVGGGMVSFSGGTTSTCDNSSTIVWDISPSIGWTKTSGSFGSTNGSSNQLLWTDGSDNIGVTFNAAGTYKIKMYNANGCGVDSTERIVCVRVPPVAAFTMDKQEFCGPAKIKVTNTTPVGTCVENTYFWTVTHVDNLNCGTASNSYSFINNTGNNSVHPELQFNQPGMYIIKLTAAVNSSFSGCPASSFTDTFIVKSKPKVAINSFPTVCVNNTISFTSNVSSCYANGAPIYAWSFTNGSQLTSDKGSPDPVKYTVPGTHAVKLDVTNECGTSSATANATITNLPIAHAGPDKTICSGSSTTIGTTTINGLSYQWTPSTGLSNANSASTDVLLSYNGDASDTTYTFVVKASAGSTCFNTDTVVVKVAKTPSLNIVASDAAVCEGGTVKLYASGADSYTWSPATGLNVTNTDTVYASPTSTTTYTVSGKINSEGCSAASNVTVIIKPFPQTDTGADTIVCIAATSVRLTGLPSGGSWSGSNVSAGGIFNPEAAGLGTFKQYYSVTVDGCTRVDSMIVRVIEQPVADAGPDTTVCAGVTAFSLQGLPAGGRWSGSTWITTNGLFTPNAPGTYSVRYTYGAGTCIATDDVQILVQPGISNNTISSDQSICLGTTASTLTGSMPSGGNGVFKYLWQRSEDGIMWTDIANAVSADYQPGVLNATTYFRRLVSTDLCTHNESVPVKISVNGDSRAQINISKSTGCTPFILNDLAFTAVIDNTVNGTYNWYVNGSLYASNSTGVFPPYTIATSNDSVEIILIAVSPYGCKSDTAIAKFYTVENPQPSFTQSLTEGCGPLKVSFDNTTPNFNRFDFLWDFGNGTTSTERQPGAMIFEAHPLQADTTYTIRLHAFKGCDTIVALRQVTVKSKPKALFAPDKSEGCSPMKVTFRNTSRGFNNSYVFDFGDGSAPVAPVGQEIQHTFNVGIKDTFYTKLIATNACGKDTLSYAIVVNPNTIKLDFALNGNERFGCLPHTVRFVNNSSGANLYQWNFGDGTVISGTKGIDTITHTFTKAGDFIVHVLATNNCSDTSDTEIITVQPRPNVAFIAAPVNACFNDSIHFTNQSEAGINYQWQFGDGSGSNQFNVSKIYTAPGNYTVQLVGRKLMAQGNSCYDTATRAVRINGATGILLYRSGYHCLTDDVRFELQSQNATQYRFVFGDGDSVATASAVIHHQYRRPGVYLPYAYLVDGNCVRKISLGDSIRIDRVQAGFTTQQTRSCGSTLIKFADTSSSYFGIKEWRWDFGDGTFSSSQNPQKLYTQPGSFNVRLTVTSSSGCLQEFVTRLDIDVNNYPLSSIISDTISCTAYTVSLDASVQSRDKIYSYAWNFGNGFTGDKKNEAVTYARAGTYNIRLIVLTVNGCADTSSRTIVVRESPIVNAGSDLRICRDQQTQLNASGANSYVWFPSSGLSCIDCKSPAASPDQTTTYVVHGTNSIGCTAADSVVVSVVQPFDIVIDGRDSICIGESTQLVATGADRYEWSPPIGLSATNIAAPVASPTFTVPYRIIGYDRYNCFSDTVSLVLGVGNYPEVNLGTGSTMWPVLRFVFNQSLQTVR